MLFCVGKILRKGASSTDLQLQSVGNDGATALKLGTFETIKVHMDSTTEPVVGWMSDDTTPSCLR